MAKSRRSCSRKNPRRMPREAMERNFQRDMDRVDECIKGSDRIDAAVVLSWTNFNEFSMLSNFFIDSICSGKIYQFYIDARVYGKPVDVMGRHITKRDVDRSIKNLQKSLARKNPRATRRACR